MGERAMFTGGGEFQRELKARVAAQLTPARIRRGRWSATGKGAILCLWALGSWALLVFVVDSWWQAIAAGLSLSVAVAGVAFSVGHDANHGAFLPSTRWNRVLGYSFDLIGASSYVWRTKHNVAHHTFTNVDGADTDIDQMPFARLAPSQPHHGYHRWQHIYMWPLYGFFAVRWHLFGDVAEVVTGKIGRVATLPKPTRRIVKIVIQCYASPPFKQI